MTNFDALIEDLIQAAYDTGCYAGDGQSGTPLHKQAIAERKQARADLEAAILSAMKELSAGWSIKLEGAWDEIHSLQNEKSILLGEISLLKGAITAAIEDPSGYWQAQLARERKRADDNLRLAAEVRSQLAELQREAQELRKQAARIRSLESQRRGLLFALRTFKSRGERMRRRAG